MDIQNQLTLMVAGSLGSYWIGLYDQDGEGQFTWVDSTPLDPNITRWNRDEPNNQNNGEDCVEMYGTSGLWNDQECFATTGYICERGTDIIKKCDEEDGWVSANNKCYRFYELQKTFEGARTYCKNLDGNLIAVNSADEQNVVTATSQLNGVTFWIGITNKYYSESSIYKWSNQEQVTYTNWALNEPGNRYYADGGDCGEVLDTAVSGQWSTAKCTDMRDGFLCERDEGICAPGWRIHKGSCYQFNSHTQLTYTDAKHNCEAQGAFLVSIFSGEDNDFIVSQFEDLQNIGITDVWIGIADYPSDGVFVWSDNSAVTFSNWRSDEPVNTIGQHDCGMIFTGDTSGQWNTENCFVLKSYVCKARTGDPIYTITPNLPVGNCPAGWNLFGNSCYYSDTSRADWVTSEAYCVSNGAHLVSINDGDEQSYISTRVGGIGVNSWIGLRDLGTTGNFVWSDGSSLDFINWSSGNPNYNSGVDACVAALVEDSKEGEWDDQNCAVSRPYICEKAKDCETFTSRTTDFDFFYRYHPSPLPSNRVEFEVRATNDVHISLSSSNTGEGQMYEIVIGGWGNTQSVIRLCPTCAHEVEVETIGILSGTQFRGFEITYTADGLISVYKYGEGIPFMEWTDPNPFQVNYIGYSTGYGSDGEFKFCNLDAGSSATVDMGPTPAFDSRCGSGWEYDSSTGNCYLFKPYDYKTWPDAEMACNIAGGNLVSISGLPEMSYINGRMVLITESRLWIGATDGSREGGWTWSDESAFRYLNWNSGEPNNAGEPGEHCAELYVNTGKWNDIDCNQEMGYICKKNGYLVSHFNVYHSMNLEGYDNLQLTNIFPEECARQCVEQTGFTCRSFEYNTATMECALSEANTAYSGIPMSYKENVDLYERPVGDQCLPGWEMYQKKCYYFDKTAYKIWEDSRTECLSYGADLVIIKDTDVENWLTTKILTLEGSYWIGLHDLSLEGDFEWVDGTKLSETGLTRWDVNEPNNVGEEDCVEIYTNGLWNDQTCTEVKGLICDADTIYDIPFEEVPTTLAPNYRCFPGWQAFGDSCYQVQLSSSSWQSARDQCRSLAAGSELASIHTLPENEYVAALVTETGSENFLTNFWIGLSDLRLSQTFEWVDASEVLFTNWNDNEPNNFGTSGEDCVEIEGGGGWNDERCSASFPSICKMPKMILEGTAAPVTIAGCEYGWVGYGGSCYGIISNSIESSWSDAESKCRDSGAMLASIKDRYEQTVITSILSQEDGTSYWIGLNSLTVSGQYQWSDNTAVSYTHWDYLEPKENNGDCVAATSGIVAGLWQVKNCTTRNDFLCERVRGGYTPPPTVTQPINPTAPSDSNCAEGWIGYANKCFKAYDFGFVVSSLRSWQDAESYCNAIGADLASFHSADEENYIKMRVGYADNGFWIGLHDRSTESGFEWSDGSVLDYVSWQEGEPNNVGTFGEDCAEMLFNGRGWNDQECTNLKNWICQIEKGKVPGSDPMLPPSSQPTYTPCPTAQDWILEGDYCYYLSAGANTRLSWTDANTWCMDNGGYLVSIHGRDEQDKLIYYASAYSYSSHWIGIREYDISGTYVWADSTPLDFENWNVGEPNDANGEEQCAEMYSDGLWNDVNCENALTFICKQVYTEPAPYTRAPTPAPSGYCPSDWDQLDHRCYKFYGQNQYDRKTWYDAQENCQAQGADLAIIYDRKIQSYLISKMKDVEFEVYIGLSDISDTEQFYWVDGAPIDYTNWNSGEPNESGGEEDCVEMVWNQQVVGKWNDIICTQESGYVCQKNIDASNSEPTPVENNCDDGYVPFHESCFRVLTSETSFQTAAATCQSDGYDLASIMDVYEQSFVETLLYGTNADAFWIGMTQNGVSGEYEWLDGWPVSYTNWAAMEPSQGSNEGCIALTVNGTWDDTGCSSNYRGICKYTSLVKPTLPPETPGSCPMDWLTYGNDCLLIRAGAGDQASFPEAQYICRTYGAQLSSIHSKAENDFILSTVQATNTDVWIGLDRDLNGAYRWVDGSSVNYLNWADNEPSYQAGDIEELCVEMYPSSGLWNDRECLQKQGYVCKASKNTLNPSLPPFTVPAITTAKEGSPEEQTGVSSGGVAGIVIGVLAAVVVAVMVVIFLMYRGKSPAVSKDPGLPPSIGFDNALYKSGEKEVSTVKLESMDPTSLA
ncbi:macrophage mannose receptor 1-like isoform X2 [Apostichopus japonicus]